MRLAAVAAVAVLVVVLALTGCAATARVYHHDDRLPEPHLPPR